jgi:hypothetical protein
MSLVSTNVDKRSRSYGVVRIGIIKTIFIALVQTRNHPNIISLNE